MSKKYYAVANGREVGIFESWEITEKLIKGYKGAKYKSFKSLHEAQEYLKGSVTINPIFTPPYEISKEKTEEIKIYTDGSCVNGFGGFGYVLIRADGILPVAGKVPFYPTTNQVAELYAIYSVLLYAISTHPSEVLRNGLTLFTDSKYSIGCLTEWHYNWQRNGWKNSKNEPVANKELIQKILDLSHGLKIRYQHVKAHNGDKYNEWADELANEGRVLP